MDYTFPRARRLTRKGDFQQVFAHGTRISRAGLTAWVYPASFPRLGCAVGRSYGNHVKRNTFKRRTRAAFRQLYDQLPPADIIIAAPRTGRAVAYDEIEAFLRYLGTRPSASRQ